MSELAPGEVLVVEATDQGSTADIAAWAKSNGEYYLGTNNKNGILYHFLRKSTEIEKSGDMTFEHTVNLDQLKEKLGNEGTVLIDVREPAEYALHHIDEAISIPLGELEEKATTLNKEDDILVICRTGNRSAYAAKSLVEKGFKKVYNVVPGMTEWTD